MELPSARKTFLAVTALACLALVASPKAADPSTVTTTFTVSTTVQTSCEVSATALDFGAYVSTSPSDATSIVTVDCSDKTPYNVGLNAGTSTGATVTTRAMTGPGGALLHYSLFQDSAMTKNWGNTVGTDTVTGIGSGTGQDLTVYGHVPSAQGVAAGAYTDTITATVTF